MVGICWTVLFVTIFFLLKHQSYVTVCGSKQHGKSQVNEMLEVMLYVFRKEDNIFKSLCTIMLSSTVLVVFSTKYWNCLNKTKNQLMTHFKLSFYITHQSSTDKIAMFLRRIRSHWLKDVGGRCDPLQRMTHAPRIPASLL